MDYKHLLQLLRQRVLPAGLSPAVAATFANLCLLTRDMSDQDALSLLQALNIDASLYATVLN